MRKICEIDSIAAYGQGATASVWHNGWSRRRKINPVWIEQVLSPAQLRYVENRKTVFRPHPRHSPTIEMFIDEENLSERDWTLIRILF